MTTFVMRIPAREHQVFAPEAFNRNVGSTIKLHMRNTTIDGLITAVEVVENGKAAHITVKI